MEHAFARKHPDYKVQEVLLTEQKQQDRQNAQFTIRYTKPSDTLEPPQPYQTSGHTDARYYHQEDGKWMASKKETWD